MTTHPPSPPPGFAWGVHDVPGWLCGSHPHSRKWGGRACEARVYRSALHAPSCSSALGQASEGCGVEVEKPGVSGVPLGCGLPDPVCTLRVYWGTGAGAPL